MTDYHGAFLTSTSNFPGQIQSSIIDTSAKSVLTGLYNNKKKDLKKLFEQNAPPSLKKLNQETMMNLENIHTKQQNIS